jgi:hypothetical protein
MWEGGCAIRTKSSSMSIPASTARLTYVDSQTENGGTTVASSGGVLKGGDASSSSGSNLFCVATSFVVYIFPHFSVLPANTDTK